MYSNLIAIENTNIVIGKLIRVVNILGQDVDSNSGGILFFLYDDGSVIKRYIPKDKYIY